MLSVVGLKESSPCIIICWNMYLIMAKYISCKLNKKKVHKFFAYNIIFLIIWFNLGKCVLNENNIHVDPDKPFICLPFFPFSFLEKRCLPLYKYTESDE